MTEGDNFIEPGMLREVEIKPDPSGLGTKQEILDDNTYTVRLSGVGYITGNYDDGCFLGNISHQQYWEQTRKNDYTAPEWNQLTMASLFPEEWQEGKVMYSITVTAILIDPPKSNQE